MIYRCYESKSAEESYRQNFLSSYLLYLFKSNGLKKIFFLDLFLYFWLRWVLLAVRTFSLVSVSKGSSGAAHVLLTVAASVAVEHVL